jgi:anti-anti-sigma factor
MSVLFPRNYSSYEDTAFGVTPMNKPVVLNGGYYDVFRTAELAAELNAIEPQSDVVLDLSNTQQLDCACLGVMIHALKEWNKRAPGTHLRLRNVVPQVEKMLHLMELDRVFIIETTAP